jgi:hypothetical protein
MLLILASCAVPSAERSTSTAPPRTTTPLSPTLKDSPHPTPAETAIAQYLIDHVGEEYFREHYKLVHEEAVAADLIKASYHYTYEPHVNDYAFTLFFDPQKRGLSDREVSVVLLEPQAFVIGLAEAEVIALENGLDPTGGSHEVNLVFEPMTDNRFAWEVVNPDASPTAEVAVPIYRVVLDVEGGEVYAKEVIKPMESHEAQP